VTHKVNKNKLGKLHGKRLSGWGTIAKDRTLYGDRALGQRRRVKKKGAIMTEKEINVVKGRPRGGGNLPAILRERRQAACECKRNSKRRPASPDAR